MGLKVLVIWLLNDHNPFLSVLKRWLDDVLLVTGSTLHKAVKTALGVCDTILVGGGLPASIVASGVLRLVNVRSVVATKKFNFAMPRGWSSSTHSVYHCDDGGVTDGKFNFYVHTKSSDQVAILLEPAPKQDLRSILKSGEVGVLDFNVCQQEPAEAAQIVRYCGRGVIEQRSLLPISLPATKVRTQWRGCRWIHRSLSVFERLLALDVPEKLIRLLVAEGIPDQFLGVVGPPTKASFSFLSSFVKWFNSSEHINKLKRKKETVEIILDPESERRPMKHNRFDDERGTGKCEQRIQWITALAPIYEEKESTLDVDIATGESSPSNADRDQKATRRDDALAQFSLWDSYLISGLDWEVDPGVLGTALEVLRSFLLTLWRKRIVRSYFKWRARRDSHHIYDGAALECIVRVANATWWTWDHGSRPLFWRWPCDYMNQALNGVRPWIDGRITPWIRRQKIADDTCHVGLIRKKLDTIIDKGYVERGSIISLMPFFHVAKGADDVRMVYDGTASGLNDQLWAPWFSLPGVSSLIRSLDPGYSMSDNDVGEMFHNFILDSELRKYCGMDVSMYYDTPQTEKFKPSRQWVRWNRLAMGLRPSPYCAVQGMMIAREMILGDQWDEINVFRWDHVKINLPGMTSYDPSKSWFAKCRKDGTIAAEMLVYVDDIRCTAPSRQEAWLAAQRTSSILASIGLQDASRKRRSPGEEPGAWTGSVVWTTNGKVVVMTTQEKWDKAKTQLEWIAENIENKEGLNHKSLERIRGFLVYVSQTYPSLVPYLKGLHATIDSWRYGRTLEGTKVSSKSTIAGNHVGDILKWEEKLGMTNLATKQPESVLPVARFREDLRCLQALTIDVAPPHRRVRMGGHAKVIYGFGDASKHGFGASIELSDEQLYWRFGQWRLDEEVSSNYRELRNLVEALEGAYMKGFLLDREVFMFTDNTTAESAFHKGTSKSILLADLVLRLRKIEMAGQCTIHVIHVAGTRMICQGTDGLSRGDKTSGVMAGENMLGFIPLHLTALERSTPIRSWVESICRDQDESYRRVKFLSPDDWVGRLGEQIHYVWTPPPAIADVAVEYLAQAVHKRSNAMHIFICPRLMTARWRKMLLKATDLMLTIPLGTDLWSSDQHEPLIMCVSFPLSVDRPWKHGRTPYLEHIRTNVSSMLPENLPGAGSMLRECFSRAWGMAAV